MQCDAGHVQGWCYSGQSDGQIPGGGGMTLMVSSESFLICKGEGQDQTGISMDYDVCR